MVEKMRHTLGLRIGTVVGVCVLIVAVIVAAAAFNSGASDRSYTALAKEQDWDSQIEKATEQWSREQSIYSMISPDITPQAFAIIYEMGPAAAPYILDKVEASGQGGGDEVFQVIAASTNLHITKEALENEDIVGKYNIGDTGTSEFYARSLRTMMKNAPKQVEKICQSNEAFDKKVAQLEEWGLLALPYLADRIEAGETQWEVCFERQMLALPAAERLDWMAQQEAARRMGKPVPENSTAELSAGFSAAEWIEQNRTELNMLKDAA